MSEPRIILPVPSVPVVEDKIELLKSHVEAYTRKDGSVVAAHDDKRTAAAPKVNYPAHVKNWTDKAHHLEQIPKEKRTPEENAAYKKASTQSMYGKGHSPEYKAHLAGKSASDDKSVAAAPKYDHPNVVGHAEKLQGGDASKAHTMHFAGKEYSASGKEGKSMHDGTPVRHFRESTGSGEDDGRHVWMDSNARVHADDTGAVKRLRGEYEAHAAKK